MLTPLLHSRSRSSPRWVTPLLAALLLAGSATALSATAGSAIAQEAGSMRAPRPADLVVLQQRNGINGEETIGVFSRRADPGELGLWRVQIWEERRDRVTIATDKIRCSQRAPMRITGTATKLLVRELNPGGPITPANRLDHLIWWAVCVPEQAGRDPADLAAVARSLGYSGLLPEREQVLIAPGR